MRGRLEHKMRTEAFILDKISEMPEYIKKFYYSLNQKSHTTKIVYINNVIRFLQHVYGEKFPDIELLKGIESYDVQKYMSEIEYFDKDGDIHMLKEASQATIYSSLSAFFMFLNRAYRMGNNPFADKMIQRPTIPEKPVVYLSVDEVREVENQILNGVGNARSIGKQKNWKYRDLLLFRIPCVNGLRVNALCEINIDDIDFYNNKILVTEKRNITKTVDFDAKTANYLRIWLKDRETLLGEAAKTEKALFISNRKTRMTVRSIENVVEKYTECIEGKHITPHKLRSTFGTNLYQKEKDIYLVSKALGHKNTSPTRRYAAVFNTDITKAVNGMADLY